MRHGREAVRGQFVFPHAQVFEGHKPHHVASHAARLSVAAVSQAPLYPSLSSRGCESVYPWRVAHLIGAEGLGVDFGTGPVLDGVTLGLEDGDRIGVVGANGAGKSTLISVLAGLTAAHTGRVTRVTGVRVGVVDQGDAFAKGATVLDAIVGDAAE